MLINPTRFLGNLLLAGGLIQDFAEHCRASGIELLVVLDASFANLCAAAFPNVRVLYYPHREMAQASFRKKAVLFIAFIRRVRAFRADLAFNIEEDTLTSRLTQLSGARFRLGCSPRRHRLGYEHVLPIAYADRPRARRHRWYSYGEVFAAVGLAERIPGYIKLNINQITEGFIQKLDKAGRMPGVPLVAIHAGATKDYKKWPESSFKELCKLLILHNIQPVILGAGKDDATRAERLMAGMQAEDGSVRLLVLNMCNQLDLPELAQLFLVCRGMVGNDSGPFHLAAAQGLPGVVIFGPSDAGIWGPIAPQSRVLQKRELCDPRCTRRACLAGYRCLQAITPGEVLENVLQTTHMADGR